MSRASGRRVCLLVGSREPAPSRLRPGDIALDAGAVETIPAYARRISARELLPAREADALLAACRELAVSWHVGAPASGPEVLDAGRSVESAFTLELGQALKLLVLLERLAALEGSLEVIADTTLPAVSVLPAGLREAGATILLSHPGGLRAAVRRTAVRGRAALTRMQGGSRARAHGPTVEDSGAPGRIRVWGLANYRNRPVLDRLQRDERFSVRILERRFENRYLPPLAGEDGPDAGSPERSLAGRADAFLRRSEELFAGIPGAGAVAFEVLRSALTRIAPQAEREARAWRGLLAADPPDVIVSGIPWGGDLRSLALAVERNGPPLFMCQDGALSEVGVGGIPVGWGAFTWGPLGTSWFGRRGLRADRLFEIGDPYLDALVTEIERARPARGIRARLRIPDGVKVLLASAQNSAPHLLSTDAADPVRAVRTILDSVAGVPSWCLVLKPHPRILVVDGRRRLNLLRRLAGRVSNARIVDPDEPIAGLMALSDAHVAEGDTLSLEMLACGRPSVLLERDGLTPLYPEFAATGAMPCVQSVQDLRALLRAGIPPPAEEARRRLVSQHLRASTSPAEALLTVLPGRESTARESPR